jgi:signal transduction histidine kinase
VIADVTEFSLVPADFIFPELFILPFRISLILLTVFAISALFSVLNDMNERKEKELSQLNIDLLKKNHLISEHELELTKANATKDKFISIIAHDLRNPLNSIIGFSDLLDKNGDGLAPQEQKEYIHTISETSRSLYDLLENLLHWSRIQGGKISYQPIPFSLTDAVNPNLGLVEAARQQKSIKIHNNIDPDVTVFADVPMITSVIRNLLGNALKFSEEGGNIFLENEIFENKLKVSVRDDGVGIDPARGTKLFQIEENTSTKGTSGESGTGLGLILCREFVELNQGEIGFDSEEGKGTTFWFTLQTEGPKDS